MTVGASGAEYGESYPPAILIRPLGREGRKKGLSAASHVVGGKGGSMSGTLLLNAGPKSFRNVS